MAREPVPPTIVQYPRPHGLWWDPWRGPVLLSHLAKYRSLMPALALILHVIDGVDTGVGGCLAWPLSVRRAWCRDLEAHTRR